MVLLEGKGRIGWLKSRRALVEFTEPEKWILLSARQRVTAGL